MQALLADSRLPCAAQAVGLQDVQGLLQTCSASFSRWFMAHVTPLLTRHPAAAVMARPLEHFGSDQVQSASSPSLSYNHWNHRHACDDGLQL